MRTYLCVWLQLTVLAAVNAAVTTSIPQLQIGQSKIVGGVAVDITTYPYQLSLRLSGSHACGASIISPYWALTAAHCCDSATSVMSLRAGSTDRTVGGTIHTIAQKIVHEKYNPTTTDYDIALLKVSKPFVYSSLIKNIALSTALPAVGTMSTVSGWGTTVSGGTSPTNLLAVSVPVVAKTDCQRSYGVSAITDRMFCAGYMNEKKDSCQGDSGGPLAITISGIRQLVGIVSWGNGCAVANYPGVYASVPNLRSWIKLKASV